MLTSVEELRGSTIRATDGEIGKVREFLFDDQSWTVRYIVADTGGWLTGRLVLISPNAVLEPGREAKELPVRLSREQVENSPPMYEHQPVSRQYEAEYYDYYNYPYYWTGPYAAVPGTFVPAGAAAAPPPPTPVDDEAAQTQEQRGDPHLRSTQEVSGYNIRAVDGEIGHVDDLLLDDDSWRIESVVIDTRDWLPGKKVAISPQAVREIDWAAREVRVAMRREEIEQGPEFNPPSAQRSSGLFG